MKKIVSIFLVTIYGMCMVACGSRSSSTEVKDNVLTEEEKAEGYTLLFNGKDFTGWKMFNGGDVKGWQVEDGVIVGYGNGGDVIACIRDSSYITYKKGLSTKLLLKPARNTS